MAQGPEKLCPRVRLATSDPDTLHTVDALSASLSFPFPSLPEPCIALQNIHTCDSCHALFLTPHTRCTALQQQSSSFSPSVRFPPILCAVNHLGGVFLYPPRSTDVLPACQKRESCVISSHSEVNSSPPPTFEKKDRPVVEKIERKNAM